MTNRTERVLAALVGGFLLVGGSAVAQPTPSVYLAAGTGTYTGGTWGMGVEVPLTSRVATSFAAGVWPAALREEVNASRAFDFDVGLKHYLAGRWLFAGVNYGLIQAEIISAGDSATELRKRHGFTLSVGLRGSFLARTYASGFIGVTSDARANRMRAFDRDSFVPHFGVMIGYEILH